MDPFLSATIENLSEYFVANSRTSLTDFMDSANNSGSSTNNIMNSPIFDSLENSSDGGSSGLNTNTNKQDSSTAMNQPSLDQIPSNSDDLDQFDLGCNDLMNRTGTTTTTSSGNLHHHHHSTTSNSINHSGRSVGASYRHASATAATPTTVSSTSRHLFSQTARTQVPIYCQIEQFDSCPSSSSVGSTSASYYQPTLNDNDLFRTTDNLEDTFKKPVFHGSAGGIGHTGGGNIHGDGHVPHLHQSKLALESVTNCNGTTSTSGLSSESSLPHRQQKPRLPPSMPPINPVDDLDDGCLDPLDDHDVKPRVLNDFDCLEVNFDQLGDHDGSASPLSMHRDPSSGLDHVKIKSEDLQQISILNDTRNTSNTTSHNNSINNHHNQDNYEQQLTSCKEAYVLVQASTPWLDLVRTVLTQLGYSGLDVVNSKATLIIRNWKPLPLEQVTDDKKATVGEILAELHGFVTLKIALVNNALAQAPTEWTETMIRQIVTTLCQNMSQLTLSKLCNISQPLISAIVRGGKRLGRRKCEEFGHWYLNYIKSMDSRPPPAPTGESIGAARLVFDKAREIPQLKAWFAESTKPSEEMLECYSKILNEERKFKPQVSAKALKNWWKNERQKLGIRQRENRGRPRLKRID